MPMTPGPWEAVLLGSDGYYIYPDRDETLETLRERMRAFAHVALDPDNPETSAANARAIAGLPRLLEAAKALVAMVEQVPFDAWTNGVTDPTGYDEGKHYANQFISDMQAAIAAIEGDE